MPPAAAKYKFGKPQSMAIHVALHHKTSYIYDREIVLNLPCTVERSTPSIDRIR